MLEARYDAIADWYADYARPVDGGRSEGQRLLEELLGIGVGTLLDVCCGTGAHAAVLRDLGWRPVGVDFSAGLLRHATARQPVARGDAAALPVASSSVPAAVAIMCHTDVDDYPAVLREIARVLMPGGRFVHIGVHPCFCGAFSDRSDPNGPVLGPGYRRTERRFDAWNPEGVRARVGATHLPLDALLTAPIEAGLTLTGVREGGPDDYPYLLSFGARKDAPQLPLGG